MSTPVASLSILRSRRFGLHLVAFALFNCLLYAWILLAHNLVPFNLTNYVDNASHYLPDSRLTRPHSFSLLDSLGQYDAQWYLKVAATGYPKHPTHTRLSDKTHLDALSYAFPPAYPLLLAAVNQVVGSLELSAFILTQILLLAGFAAVYVLVARWYTPQHAAGTTWLLFAYPFSIFYRSYFSEGLFLILLALLLDTLRSRQWFRAAVIAGWLAVTRFVGAAGVLVVAAQALIHYRPPRLKLPKLAAILALAALPLIALMAVCYVQTGHPLYFVTIHSAWVSTQAPGYDTLWSIAHFTRLPWHSFHESRLDVISIVGAGILLWRSARWLPPVWWYLALLLWLIPILTSDTMSASRFQSVNLPLFIYVAHALPRWPYRIVLTLSAIGLFVVAILFVNWVWIG